MSAWADPVGIDRLANLADACPEPVPEDVPDVMYGVPGYLQVLHKHARDVMAPEHLETREKIWASQDSLEDQQSLSPWMTLEPSTDLQEWEGVLRNVMGCDDRACTRLREILQLQGPRGYAEGCRILAHLFKDKDKDPDNQNRDRSSWMKRGLQGGQGCPSTS